MNQIRLTLTVEEVNAIMQVLGNLPTSSGAYPLLVKIKDITDNQLKEINNSSQ